MYITGPDVVKTVTGAEVTHEELGGADSHATRSGVAHFVYDTEEECLEEVRRLLSFLPSNNLDDTPALPSDDPPTRCDPELRYLVPDEPNRPYDVRDIIHRIVDEEDFMEVQSRFAPNVVVGFGRFNGRSVGLVGNQPAYLAGVLDINASGKAARFVRFCDCFNIPLGDPGGRSRVHARGGSGIWRHHTARGQADLRLCRSYCAQDRRYHPQGLWRGVYCHEQQTPADRHQPGLALGGNRRDGAGRGG